MKINLTRYTLAGSALLVILAFFIGRWTASPPSEPNGPQNHANHSTGSTDPTTWTCAMHPQIQQPEPGQCPICGMNLIPLKNDSGSQQGPRTLSMSESSKALADIQTTLIEKRFPEAEIRLVGKLEYDETKVKSLTARFPARIDELFVNFNGVSVKEGQHLARVYSPELLTAQSELLSAYRFSPTSSSTRAAKEKLRLWDLRPEQIEEIIESNQAKDHFELKAPMSGVVVSKNVNEGDYLKTGQALFKIVDLSELWLKLDAYESDLSWLRFGQSIAFSVQSYPGTDFQGRIAFIEPEIDQRTRTVSVRVNVPNTEGKLKPGMFARAIAHSKVAQAGKVYAPEFAGKWISPMHPEIVMDAPGLCSICGMDLVPAEQLGYVQDLDETPPLVVPASAVLRTGNRAVVYIEVPNTENPTFEGREIEIGPRAGDIFVVVSGLQEGERVVTNGAFKIDSSLQIQAKPSMMNPEGGGPVPGHNHSKANEANESANNQTIIEIDTNIATLIMDPYFELQAALAGDDLESARTALMQMFEATGHSGTLPNKLHEMLEAPSLETVRPGFETLSNAIALTVKSNPSFFEGAVLQMHCPMAFKGKGASWLQHEEPLLNPYFGALMLNCGTMQADLTQSQSSAEHSNHAH
ncbi:MAG: efflux RND transporter periplasmic adaptor subunit [Verrucomicrobiia bacterium]